MNRNIIIALLMAVSVPSLATDRTWTGTVSGSWSTGTASNWNPIGYTTTNDNLTFGNLITNRYAVSVTSAQNAKSITFPASNTNAYTLSSGTINLYGNLTNLPTGVTNTITSTLKRMTSPVTYYIDGYLLTRSSSANTAPVNTDFTITGSGTWNSQGYVISGYNIVLTNSVTVKGSIICDTLDIYSTKIDEVSVTYNLTVHAGGELRLIDATADADGAFTNEVGATTTISLRHDGNDTSYVGAQGEVSLKGTLNLFLDETTAGEFVDSELWSVIHSYTAPFSDYDLSAVTVDPASSGSFAGCTFSKTSRLPPSRSEYFTSAVEYGTLTTESGDVWMSTPNAKGYRLWVCYQHASDGPYYINVFCLRDDSGDMFSVMGE